MRFAAATSYTRNIARREDGNLNNQLVLRAAINLTVSNL